MKINIAELRSVTELLFQHLEKINLEDQNGDEISLENDYYWDFSGKDLYDMQNDPDKLDVGQLSEDWEDLQKILAGQIRPITYNFVDLAAILRAIGLKIVA